MLKVSFAAHRVAALESAMIEWAERIRTSSAESLSKSVSFSKASVVRLNPANSAAIARAVGLGELS